MRMLLREILRLATVGVVGLLCLGYLSGCKTTTSSNVAMMMNEEIPTSILYSELSYIFKAWSEWEI